MKLDEFVLLTEDQRISVLWREAKMVAQRNDDNYNIFLYQVYSFYIEVWYSKNLMNIYNLKSFSNTDLLEPYLEEINISSLTRLLC